MNKQFTLNDFDFDLPKDLIAQTPANKRIDSKLLHLENNQITDCSFHQVVDFLKPGDILVLNNTKVIPARLNGYKDSGGKIEIFVERIQGEKEALCMIKANRSPKIDDKIIIHGYQANIKDKNNQFYLIELKESNWETLTKEYGDIPLPPYIQRKTKQFDEDRYQTVYAKEKGAVAAPTAGLHFNNQLLESLESKGVIITFITLHVGAGTFLPVKTENLEAHQMHYELFFIPEETKQIINQGKKEKRRIIAVGTTSLRTLESAAKNNLIDQTHGDTNLFIKPGFNFQIVDILITNFHLPKSTLMMLVSAFSGYDAIRQAYQHAIDNKYRFFSYGDAMFLHKNIDKYQK